MTITARILATTAALALLLAGCSDDEPEDTNGTEPTVEVPTEPTADIPGEPTGGVPADAPKVTNPVANVEKYMQAPCDALTKAQAADLKFNANVKPDPAYSEGPQCLLENENGDNISVVFLKNQPLGIGGIYRNKQEDPEFYEYFEPVDLGGFPGVYANSIDNRANGACGLAVGVTDTQVVMLVGSVDSTPGITNTCDLLKSAAEAALSTMSKA